MAKRLELLSTLLESAMLTITPCHQLITVSQTRTSNLYSHGSGTHWHPIREESSVYRGQSLLPQFHQNDYPCNCNTLSTKDTRAFHRVLFHTNFFLATHHPSTPANWSLLRRGMSLPRRLSWVRLPVCLASIRACMPAVTGMLSDDRRRAC